MRQSLWSAFPKPDERLTVDLSRIEKKAAFAILAECPIALELWASYSVRSGAKGTLAGSSIAGQTVVKDMQGLKRVQETRTDLDHFLYSVSSFLKTYGGIRLPAGRASGEPW